MPIFGSGRPADPTADELAAAEVDLERIRQGGIPLGAEERLRRVGAQERPFFTSDLSAKEYALADASGLQPVAQVMGSSVVQHGWYANRNAMWSTSGEVPALAEPWNIARDRAFDRMRQEAQHAGADGVIGVEINASTLGDRANLELVVFGTAVRDHGVAARRDRPLGMCTLSGQEVDKLRRIGAEVRGVVGHTTVICVRLSPGSNWVMNSGSGIFSTVRNVEITEIAYGVSQARNRAMAHVRQQGQAVGANDIVISTLSHSIEHREYDQGGGMRYHLFYVTMNVLGTAVALGAHPPHPAPFTSPMMSINLGK